ncbi:MAG: ATP-binding protein [Desulfomonile tiedjei]|uniref:histidine kinase n=1 Tax=Desulfomonile tiedjei TaxID=2358 RepID=A0A9D6Z4Y8_9BACT|nr:ATP-binding protein [Desulfomonile tiedjei]
MQDLSLHILDVAENGIAAGADLVQMTVEEDTKEDRLTITIEDNGRGMSPDFLARALDPFVTTRTTRRVGLGLSLFQQSAQGAEGDLKVDSTPGLGTKVIVRMRHGHIDRKPMGDMAETVTTLIQGNPDVDFVYVHRRNGREFSLDTREIRSELEEIAINNPEVIGLIQDNLRSSLEEIA